MRTHDTCLSVPGLAFVKTMTIRKLSGVTKVTMYELFGVVLLQSNRVINDSYQNDYER